MENMYLGFAALVPKFFDIGVNIVIALLILIAGWWLSSILGNWVRRAAQRSPRIDATIVPMFYSAVVWVVRIFTVIAVLARFGVQTASLIAVLGAASLAIGLALQGTLQNISAGIMLLVLRPIRAGESIALSSGTDGTVAEVGLFLTRLVKGDGVHVTLPNSVVWNATITNFSRNTTRKLDMPVGIRYGDDLDQAMAQLTALVDAHPMIMKDPAPVIRVNEYRDNVVVVMVSVWAEVGKYWEMRGDLLRTTRQMLDEKGFKPPVPVYDVASGPQAAGDGGTAGQPQPAGDGPVPTTGTVLPPPPR
ncbi:mechanosensitive ion channel [Alcaligenaceae bacterium C4P045]|nr:mechanosensitive ion channel [Alcaligenaceae bacterium B3P038]MDQ2147510.1 mechanosensitive ion channel [Alcaligenaceae bacterium C4P045]